MGTQQAFTEEQVSVLLWLKVFNGYNEGELKDKTLDEKIEAIEWGDKSWEGITREQIDNGIDLMQSLGLLDIVGDDERYVLTVKGKVFFAALSVIEGFSDETKTNILNGSIKALDFVKDHKEEILCILSIIFG